MALTCGVVAAVHGGKGVMHFSFFTHGETRWRERLYCCLCEEGKLHVVFLPVETTAEDHHSHQDTLFSLSVQNSICAKSNVLGYWDEGGFWGGGGATHE